jgi:hypothetical protein
MRYPACARLTSSQCQDREPADDRDCPRPCPSPQSQRRPDEFSPRWLWPFDSCDGSRAGYPQLATPARGCFGSAPGGWTRRSGRGLRSCARQSSAGGVDRLGEWRQRCRGGLVCRHNNRDSHASVDPPGRDPAATTCFATTTGNFPHCDFSCRHRCRLANSDLAMSGTCLLAACPCRLKNTG